MYFSRRNTDKIRIRLATRVAVDLYALSRASSFGPDPIRELVAKGFGGLLRDAILDSGVDMGEPLRIELKPTGDLDTIHRDYKETAALILEYVPETLPPRDRMSTPDGPPLYWVYKWRELERKPSMFTPQYMPGPSPYAAGKDAMGKLLSEPRAITDDPQA